MRPPSLEFVDLEPELAARLEQEFRSLYARRFDELTRSGVLKPLAERDAHEHAYYALRALYPALATGRWSVVRPAKNVPR